MYLRKAFKICFENTRHCLNIEVSELRTYVCKTFKHNLVDLGFTGKNFVFQPKNDHPSTDPLNQAFQKSFSPNGSFSKIDI